MKKIDVAIQSYKKPESMVYTLLSLKKFCGGNIDTIYINDDCSNDGTVEHYFSESLKETMYPIKLKIRVNQKPSGYTHTLMTKKMWKKKNIKYKLRAMVQMPLKRVKFYDTEDDIRYQWAINSTDKKYLMLIHDDIKFFDNIAKVYIETAQTNENLIIVGDLGGSTRCPFGPCGDKCSPEKILNGEYPIDTWPITGKHSLVHTILGRYKRNCRINEWCCLLDVDKTRKIQNEKGIYFGNYEGGGDVATYWFHEIIKLSYDFTDPVPNIEERKNYYLHWWQGHEGHSVWFDKGEGKSKYEKEFIIDCIKNEFNFDYE